jgi:anaerobic selenocysteine-containing dehydrogenase
MHYEGRESREMRWFEGDMLAAQELFTEVVEHKGTETTETTREMRVIKWTDFQKKYKPASELNHGDSPDLHELFEWYEAEFQRIVYRRFRSLYTSIWSTEPNPQAYETKKDQIINQEEGQKTELERKRLQEARDHDDIKKVDKMTLKESIEHEQKLKKLDEEENSITTEQQQYPQFNVIVPDHRVRRLQHLLVDLVKALDAFTTVKLKRPERKCTMRTENRVPGGTSNPLGLVTDDRIPCDCNSLDCNPYQEPFSHRQLPTKKSTNRPAGREPSKPSRDHQIKSRVPPTRTGVVDAEKGISQ